jgi:plasmid stabilization system protein ParE
LNTCDCYKASLVPAKLVPRRPGIRKLLHAPYKIYYRVHIRRKVVEILHFWHGARQDPGGWP